MMAVPINYSDYQFKCRSCFKAIKLEQKCYNFDENHRKVIGNLTGFEIPAIDESRAKICSACATVIVEFAKIQQRMFLLQKGFLEFMGQDPKIERHVNVAEHQAVALLKKPDKKQFSQPRKLMKVARVTKLEYLMRMLPTLSTEQQHATHCTICQKQFSYPFTAASHIKMVHLKIKDYECDLCNYATGIKCNLQRHVQRNHIPDFSTKVKCPNCHLFITRKYLLTHRMQLHPREILPELKKRTSYICCKKLFVTQGNVIRHCKRLHGGERIYKTFGAKQGRKTQ